MMSVRDSTRRLLNAVMTLHRKAILREVAQAKGALTLAERRVTNQATVVKAEQELHWKLREQALKAYKILGEVESNANAELATLAPRN